MTELLTEQQAAALLKVSVKSLQGWRIRGGGPAFRKLGRCVRYAMADLDAFIQAAVRQSTSEQRSNPSGRPSIRAEHLLNQTGRTPFKPINPIKPTMGTPSPRPAEGGTPAGSPPPTRRRHAIRGRRRWIRITPKNQD